ncbi:MAG: hypothetical protein RLZZ546_3050 [Bacteroidota bacterium]|jgi:hypothetical protein
MKFRFLNIAIWTFCLLFFNNGSSQNSPKVQDKSNPFEISGRIVTSAETLSGINNNIDTFDLNSTDNPFEVNHVPIRKANSLQNSITKIATAKPKVSEKFIFWIMIFSWVMLAIVISNKTNLISYLVRSVFNINMMKLTKRDESSGYNFHFTLLYICFFINISVFIYMLQKHFGGSIGIKIWFLIFCAVLGVYLLRHVFLFLLSRVFPIEKESSLFSYIIFVFNILLGISIIPLNLILSYAPSTLHLSTFYVGIGFIILFYIIRCLRGFSISVFLIGQGIVPFFIYLCTAEIAPLMLLYRVISNINVT